MDPEPATAGYAMARWSAKALLVTAGVALVGGALWYARAAVVPLIVAALVATQLRPLSEVLARRMPRGLAIAACMLGLLVVLIGIAWLFADALFGDLGGVGADITKGVDVALDWLREHSAWVKDNEQGIRDFLASVLPSAKAAASGIFTAALGGLSLAAALVSGALLAYVFLLYLLTGGDAVWGWIQDRFDPGRRERVARAGAAAWSAASGYIRGIALVATIDSLVIGLGMLVIGTPHAGTLVLLSFLCLFVPILGAWVSGAVIVLVTLAAQGSGAALAMTVVILVAQQLDSMFVTPLVYQQTVNLHPIVTLIGVIVGSQLMGIIGALLAVPMIAVGWAIWNAIEEPRSEAVVATPAPDGDSLPAWQTMTAPSSSP